MEQGNYSVYRTTIDQIMRGEEKLPSLPDITLKIRHELADANTTSERLAHLISGDPSLTVMLMRYAASPLYKTQQTPKSLEQVISLLGMATVDRLVMLHSIRSLFIMQNPQLKKLFASAWQRQSLKASISRFCAQKLGFNPADEALIGSLLSEIGTLAILSSLTESSVPPSQQIYLQLCRQYSKSLGVIIIKKWSLDDNYAEMVKASGDWTYSSRSELTLTDILNLALYHTIVWMRRNHNLPDLDTLAAYKKLPAPFNQYDANGLLGIISNHKKEIVQIAKSLH